MPNNAVIFNKVTGNFKKGPEPRRVGKYFKKYCFYLIKNFPYFQL